MSAEHLHLEPEDLTELAALSASAGERTAPDERLSAARACARCGPQLRELEELLARSRAALERATRVPEPVRERLTDAVLARTTRAAVFDEPPISFGALLASSLRRSRLLRLAAASLLVHLIALPVLAWYVIDRRQEPQVLITIEPPSEPLEWAEPEVERLPPPVLPAPGMNEPGFDVLPVLADPEPLRVENSVRLARFELGRGGPTLPDEPAGGETTRVERLLRARAELIARSARGVEPAALDALTPAPVARASALERALEAELRLDVWLLTERLDGLDAALETLCVDGESAPAGRRLEAAALARAEAYGLLNARQRARLEGARAEARGGADALSRELLGGDEPDGRRVSPLGRAWIDALEAALPAEVRDGGVARAWLTSVR